MRRGLVLGNSHTACLREAWREARSPTVELEFCAAHRELIDGLAFVDGEAVATTDDLCATLDRLGMRRRFRLDAYDFFVVTGCQLAIFRAVEAARSMAVWPEPAGPRLLVSGPCFREALADALRETTACRLVRGLASAGAPVLVLPQPHPDESVLSPDSRFGGFRRVRDHDRGAWLDSMFQDAAESTFAGLAAVLHQPDETRAHHICTASGWSEGSVMLAARRHEHKAEDILHANARYGALQLKQIAGALEAACPPMGAALRRGSGAAGSAHPPRRAAPDP